MDFTGVAMVTGAGSGIAILSTVSCSSRLDTKTAAGIGRATALLYAKEGCKKIAICDISLKGLEETQALIESSNAGTNVKSLVCDVSDEATVQNTVDEIVRDFGRLDYCANVAGIVQLGAQTADMTTAFFDRHYNVNLRGLFFCERAQLQVMLKQDPLPSKHSGHAYRGSIVNVSSMDGLTGSPYIPAYTASKHGVVGLTRADGMFYGRHGIRINAVCPGAVSTPILANSGNPVDQTPLIDANTIANALQRLAEPGEIAQAIIWLSSGRASYITATTLACTGGMTGA